MKNKFDPYLSRGLLALVPIMAVAFAPFTAHAAADSVSAIDAPVSAIGDSMTDLPAEFTTSAPSVEDVVVTPSANIAAEPEVVPAAPEKELQAVTTMTPLPEASELDSGESAQGSPMGSTGAVQQHSGQFYDSVALTPNNELAGAGGVGPRKVDPKYEPGQRYVIVERNAQSSSVSAQYVAASRALSLGRYAAALDMFEKLYKQNDRDPRILLGLAISQQGAGFTESAARTYEDILRIDPRNEQAIVNLMGIMKGQYPAVTIQKLLTLQKELPNNPGIPAHIGLAYAEMKQYEDALRYLEIAASMDPRNPSHVYNMAIVSDMKNDSKRAIKFYEDALQMDATYGSSATSLNREEIYDRLSVLRRRV